MARTIYKYTDNKFVHAFMRGELRIRSLSYYRELEKTNPLGDPLDGCVVFAPDGGLEITNHTQGWTRRIPASAFKSTMKKTDEILVFCTSLRLDEALAKRFQKNACIAIKDRAAFCQRLRAAMEPLVAAPCVFRALPVSYYDAENPPGASWAIPEVILTSKRREPFGMETEYRFACGPSSAFAFEGAHYQLATGDSEEASSSKIIHREHDLQLGDLKSICSVHLF